MGYPYPNFCLCASWGPYVRGSGQSSSSNIERRVSGFRVQGLGN